MRPEAGPPFPAAPPALGQLPPGLARLSLCVERFCRELGLQAGARLLLALSGGADSTALAVLLHVLTPRLGLSLFALSVDHGLRPESAKDAEQARALCRWLGIPCTVRRRDVAEAARGWGCGLEDAGRRVRHALLEEERAALGADWIVLGHHAGDLSEDVLLRLTRGAGWPALAGMTAKDDARRLLRPLIFTPPKDLRALLRELHVPWREDASNASPAFRRNRLRLNVLPQLRKENPALDKSCATLHRLAELDSDFWERALDAALAAQPWQEIEEGGAPAILLPAALLAGLHPAARLRLYVRGIKALLGHAAGSRGQPRGATLLALDVALREGRGNTRFQLPGNVEALVRGGSVSFTKAAHSPRKSSRPAAATPSTSRP